MLEIRNLRFCYEKATDLQFPDLELKKGQAYLLFGPSGCGKSTLLHLMSLLLRPKSGEIYFEQKKVSSLDRKAANNFRVKHFGLIFQKSFFIKSLSVKENLALALKLSKKKEVLDKITDLTQRLGIDSLLSKKVHQLSGGELQRVAIARTLLTEPKVIFADEPTSSLDRKNADNVITLLKEESQRLEATLVIVSHDERLKSQFDHQIELVHV